MKSCGFWMPAESISAAVNALIAAGVSVESFRAQTGSYDDFFELFLGQRHRRGERRQRQQHRGSDGYASEHAHRFPLERWLLRRRTLSQNATLVTAPCW